MPELKYFAVVLFYLLFVSALFTTIINDKEGTSLIGINIPDKYLTAQYQNYTENNTYFSENLIPYGFFDNSRWEKTNLGITLSQDSLFKSVLPIDNLIPIDSIYTATYYINNSPLQPFSIYPQYSENQDRIEIYLDTTGYHIVNYLYPTMLPFGDKYFYSISGLMTQEYFILKTVYNSNSELLSLYENDNLIFTQNNLPYILSPNCYYAGISSQSKGITLERLNGNTQNFNPDEASGIEYAFNYIFSMLKIIFWTIDEAYLPFSLNLLIVKFPLALAIMFLVMVLRGV